MDENQRQLIQKINALAEQVCPECESTAHIETKHCERLLKVDVPPVKLGNKNKSGKCGMSGIRVRKLYTCRVGQVDFMICKNCKGVMDL